MEYRDEKIAELKRERHRLKYTDITGEGVFISDVFVTFGPREILGAARLYIPDTFIEMPKEVQRMKFPSVSRPQVILTSLDSSVNFAFSLVDIRTPDSQIGTLTLQMKETLKTANPAAVFYIEESELLDSGRPLCMFDFKNFGVDGPMYNMTCFTPLGPQTLHGTFICPEQDAGEWKYMAWAAFKTIRAMKQKE